MDSTASIHFFETQFQRQVLEAEAGLNPFEQQALPYLQGAVLDYGCGLGQLAPRPPAGAAACSRSMRAAPPSSTCARSPGPKR